VVATKQTVANTTKAAYDAAQATKDASQRKKDEEERLKISKEYNDNSTIKADKEFLLQDFKDQFDSFDENTELTED
jgi:hypothetical protein